MARFEPHLLALLAALALALLGLGVLVVAWRRARRHEARLQDSLAEQRRLREELSALTRRLMHVQEDERRTLSRELHDDIGQSITAMKLGAMAIDDDPGARAEIAGEIVATADQAIARLRNLSLLLRPPQLDALGLEAALRGQVDQLSRNARTRLVLQADPLSRRPPAAVELACFRIAQEAMTNAVRHADASEVRIRVAEDAGALLLEVRDDGRGLDPGAPRGLGLASMRERAGQLHGTIELDAAPGAGTCVRARIPLDQGATHA